MELKSPVMKRKRTQGNLTHDDDVLGKNLLELDMYLVEEDSERIDAVCMREKN